MIVPLRRRSVIGSSGKSGLPPEYMRVEYLESTGTQWIDTGYIVSGNELEFNIKLYPQKLR